MHDLSLQAHLHYPRVYTSGAKIIVTDSLRITQIMLAKGFGGAERHFVDLSLELAQRGHRVQAICHRDFQGLASLDGVPNIHIEPCRVFGSWDMVAAWRMTRRVAKFRPQLLHAHLARGAHLASQASAAARLPLVANMHNYIKLKYYRAVDHFVIASAVQRDHLLRGGVDAHRITHIPHFCRTAARERSGLQQRVDFVSLGRMVTKKGFDVLIDALCILRKRGIDAHLLLGGAGEQEVALHQQVAACGLGAAVRFAGWVNAVPEFLERGDIFVLPSREEPFGIVLLEAIAMGMPVVATRTDGGLEILSEESAHLVQCDDVEALAAGMEDALINRSESARRAANATRRYRETYTSERVVPQYEVLYRRLLS